jgi:hypothetical protein
MVVASAVDEQGEQIFPRTWNHDFIDLPVPQKDQQNTPSFSAEVMTGLARWKKPRERMIFILCGAAGLRIGELLGIEIDKHISPDFLTLYIQQQVRRGRSNNGSRLRMPSAKSIFTRRLPLGSNSSLAAASMDSCSALEPGSRFRRPT